MPVSAYCDHVMNYLSRRAGQHTAVLNLKEISDDDRIMELDWKAPGISHCICIVDDAMSDDSWASRCQEIREISPSAAVTIDRWNAERVYEEVTACRPLALRVCPDRIDNASETLQRFQSLTSEYLDKFREVHNQIRFVGMSVYKDEATGAVPLDKLYIPLRVVAEDNSDADDAKRVDPLTLIEPGSRHVVLGDPGSGKSTLLKFLSLVGWHEDLRTRFELAKDQRIPLLITLRQYSDELKTRPELSILEYAAERTEKELGVSGVAPEFLEYHLCVGNAMLLLDGIDELPNLEFKQTVRERVAELVRLWPACTVVITSRVVGYEKDARFTDDNYRHHRVASLSSNDVKGFVKLWYEDRIDGDLEREEHYADLSSILDDEQNESIRDLATNPLLLTIICLVHRVDGTLPDERVVLYHKCTETLLNTWHSWKFRTGDKTKRNATERRNRARMEFIAYCMHGLFDSEDENQRAVVPLEELKEILVDYLERMEPLIADPEQEADLFLQFVRERAGLLVEVGNGQYSFVHLTFQEYLAATYLRKEMESVPTDPDAAIGINAVWEMISRNKRHANPRWHETLRLLVASLERPDAQRFLVERILPNEKPVDQRYQARCLLAGGILVDQVEGALCESQQIVDRLMRCCMAAPVDETFAGPFNLLVRYRKRRPDAEAAIESAARDLAENYTDDERRLHLGLLLVGLGWRKEEVEATVPSWIPSNAADILSTFIFEDQPQSKRRELAWLVALTHSMIRPNGAATIALTDCLSHEQLFSMRTLLSWIGAHTLSDYALLSICYEDWVSSGATLTAYDDLFTTHRARAGAQAGAQARAQARAQVLWRAVGRALRRDRDQDRARAQARARALALDLDLDLDLDLELELGIPYFRLAVFGSSERQADPRWWQALKTQRLDVLDFKTLADIDPRASGPTDWRLNVKWLESVAKLLMFDIGYFLTGEHDSREDSPYEELATETRNIGLPVLQIAQCLRDLAYGDGSRAEDLVAMVKSDDPEYQKIFRDALWID